MNLIHVAHQDFREGSFPTRESRDKTCSLLRVKESCFHHIHTQIRYPPPINIKNPIPYSTVKGIKDCHTVCILIPLTEVSRGMAFALVTTKKGDAPF